MACLKISSIGQQWLFSTFGEGLIFKDYESGPEFRVDLLNQLVDFLIREQVQGVFFFLLRCQEVVSDFQFRLSDVPQPETFEDDQSDVVLSLGVIHSHPLTLRRQ